MELKVKDLYRMLCKLMNEGHGEKTLYMMTDEEGNDYRKMWFEPTTDPKEIKKIMESSCSGLSNCDDINNAVIIG